MADTVKIRLDVWGPPAHRRHVARHDYSVVDGDLGPLTAQLAREVQAGFLVNVRQITDPDEQGPTEDFDDRGATQLNE